MSLYDIFTVTDGKVNECYMPVIETSEQEDMWRGYLRLHHIRNVECLIRYLSEEFVSLCSNKSMVLWNGSARKAFLQHTASVVVNGIVISKDDGPRKPHPVRASGISIRSPSSGMILTFPSQSVVLSGPSSSALV